MNALKKAAAKVWVAIKKIIFGGGGGPIIKL